MALDIKVPAVGESITEVTIARWLKKTGDYVDMDEILCELESDKATFELNAESSGILTTNGNEGDTLAVGAVICSIDTSATKPKGDVDQSSAEKTSEPAKISELNEAPSKNIKHPSPAAAKVLAEKGIMAQSVQGTGKDGRITLDDAQKAEKQTTSAANSNKVTETPALPSGLRTERREKMSSLRKTISRRLVAVKNETAMLTTFNEVDMKPVMDLRNKYKEAFKEKHGIGLGFMSFFTRAVCEALQEYPAVNARIENDEIVYHTYCDISIAVSTPKGLVVPVVRNAESLTLAGIEKAIADLASKARDGRLTLEEMSGGTFTITNGGVFGSLMSTPIINAPQSAILGMHNIVERPVVLQGNIVARPMMYIALSYDHRIIDGRESVSFLVRVKQLMEDPARLLLGV